MNDASHYSQRPTETIPKVELRESPATSCVKARAKLENIGLYLEHTQGGAGDESLFQDCLKRFYELAEPQLAEWVIDARLFADGEETTLRGILAAIDVELAAWQHHGIVTSQVEPLTEFSAALTELQQGILDNEDLDEGLRRRLERDIYGLHQA